VTLVTRQLAAEDRGLAWELAAITFFPDALVRASAAASETVPQTHKRVGDVLGREGLALDAPPAWTPRPLVNADAYLSVAKRLAVALRPAPMRNFELEVADWWFTPAPRRRATNVAQGARRQHRARTRPAPGRARA
jgi:hypothetical protein